MTVVAPVRLKNHFALVLDASSSMTAGGHARGVPPLHDAQLRALTDAKDQENYVSCFSFGEDGHPTRELYYQRQAATVPLGLADYKATGGSTPLIDGVMRAIGRLDDGQADVSKFVLVLTDGEENASKGSASALADKIKALQATDLWTIVFLVPAGQEGKVRSLGVPAGNVRAWSDVKQAAAELERGTVAAVQSRRGGARSVTSYFEPDLSKIKPGDLSKLRDVTGAAKVFEVKDEEPILAFVNRKTKGKFKPGTAFYQLMKKEKEVQNYKNLLLIEKATGKVFTGPVEDVRALLGLPTQGTIPMAPGNHGGFDVMIQSNSNNRKLPRGTKLAVWDPTA